MSKNQNVTFCEGTKPPNYGKMRIHTAHKKKQVIDTDIKLIMSQTNVTYEVAEKAYIGFDGDICSSILYIEEQFYTLEDLKPHP